MTTAHEILQAAQQHMKDRAKKYDNPKGERSMAATVTAFNAVTGLTMTEEQGWLFMVMLKAVRSQQGDYHEDSYEDGAAYFSLAGECASKQDRSCEEGWVKWDGYSPYGPPIKDSTSIQALCRNKNKLTGFVNQFAWRHLGSHEDIIAYRIIE